ncbi:MAG TPA: sugar phosphate isomerase/epimerase family protein [Thermomicrobiales bacterium]|jgi:sugar phosphate isomerase/epimerase
MSAERRPVLISVMQYEDELDRDELAIGDVIAKAVQFGVAGIEIRPQYWRDRARELPAARDEIVRHALLVTYATTTTLFSTDPQDAERLRQDIDDAQLLGAPQLRVFQGPAPADDDEAGWAAGRAMADYAATRGVTLALENYSGLPGGTIAEMWRTLDRIPTLAVNLDIANYARHGEDVLTAIARFGDRAISVHVKDQEPSAPWTSYPLGGGELHLAQIFPALEALPQRLLYCFEFRGEGDPDGRIAQSLAYLRHRAWE